MFLNSNLIMPEYWHLILHADEGFLEEKMELVNLANFRSVLWPWKENSIAQDHEVKSKSPDANYNMTAPPLDCESWRTLHGFTHYSLLGSIEPRQGIAMADTL